MRRPPPITRLLAFPATAGVMLLAIAVTIATWREHLTLYNFTLDARAMHGEPWRFVTAALPHGNLLHLGFNLYWLWVLGTLVEERLGHFPALGLYAVLAAIPLAAEYALLIGGIGLSGVGFGLVGMVWTLGKHDPRFSDGVDKSTLQLFLVWGLICVLTTITKVMPVANIAHGVGFVAGCIIGQAIGVNRAYWAILGLLAVACAAGAGRWRGAVNVDRKAAASAEAWAAQHTLDSGKPARAAAIFRAALALDPELHYWYNLAVVDKQLGDDAAELADTQSGCEHADALACAHLGDVYFFGTGVPVDKAEAANAYQRACDHGEALGCDDRGDLYLDDNKPDAARPLYERACKLGNQDGCKRRDRLAHGE